MNLATASLERQSLDILTATLHSGIWNLDCDSQGRICRVSWDSSCRTLFGFQNTADFPDELQSWSRLLAPLDRERAQQELSDALASVSDKYDSRYRMLFVDGSLHWLHSRATILRRPDGTASHVVGLFQDVTAEERQKERSRQAEAFHNACTRLNLCEYYVNLDDNTFASMKAGATPLSHLRSDDGWDALAADYLNQFIRAEDMQAVADLLDRRCILERFARGETDFGLDSLVRLNGEVRWVRNTVMRAEARGADNCALIFMRDVTAHKVQEDEKKELAAESSAMSQMLASVVKFVNRFAVCDLENDTYEFRNFHDHAIYQTKGAYHILREQIGATLRAVDPNLSIYDMISPENLRDRLPTPDSIWRFEYCTLDESEYKMMSYVPLEWKNGVLTKVLMLGQVITEEKRRQIAAQKALKEAFDAAQQANQAKTSFLANMSHDIRTPMNAIVGLTAIAGANAANAAKVKSCLAQITRSSRHLLGLINEVLDMSRIESGKIVLNEDDFNLPELIDNLILLVKSDMDRHHHQFDVRISRIQHEDVRGDSLRIQQIFTNIVSNAVKYTPDGGRITFSIEEKPTHHRNIACFEFIVEDNGMGMTPEFQKVIFEPFTRADATRTTRIPGTGLGMAITRSIVNMMNGDIRIESAPGKGSRFAVTIFLKTQPAVQASTEALADLPVLVVDDDLQTCLNTTALLNEIGLKSDWADSGEKAVACVTQRHAACDDFFAVIIDWKMPGMSGIETVRQIRRIVGSEITVIVMSAYDFSDIADEAREAGVDAFITKPLFKSKLITTLSELVRHDDIASPETVAKTAKIDCSGKNILLAEDNELNREVACEILSMTGATVECAENGREALDMICNRPDGYYSLVFMDIQMPEMNGYEAAAAIRAMGTPYTQSLPIVAMTANAFAEDVVLTRNAGMNEHVAKPIELARLNAVMQRWLSE